MAGCMRMSSWCSAPLNCAAAVVLLTQVETPGISLTEDMVKKMRWKLKVRGGLTGHNLWGVSCPYLFFDCA